MQTVTHNLSTGEIVFEEVSAEEISLKEINNQSALVLNAREKRNSLLAQSDWTQVADAPIDKTAWASYRQALRDIPSQAGFPNTITWPTEPEV